MSDKTPNHFAFATSEVEFLKDDAGDRRYYPIDLLPVPDTSKTADLEAQILRKISSSLGISYDQLKSDYAAQTNIDLKQERKKARAFRLLRYGDNRRQWKRANRLLAEACYSGVERAHIRSEATRLRMRDIFNRQAAVHVYCMKMEIRDGD